MNAVHANYERAGCNVAPLPVHVQTLWPGEREVASIIFARGPSTAAEVQERLSKSLSMSAVRITLRRLVAKGILECHGGARGRGNPAIYSPTTVSERAQSRAIQKLTTEYFGGSAFRLVVAALSSGEFADEDLERLAEEIACKSSRRQHSSLTLNR